jgi:hypothetical protein
MVHILQFWDCAIRGDGNLGVLLALKAELLQGKRINIRNQYNSGKGWHIKCFG